MLDFDNRDLTDSFEDEFRKKKRKRRTGGSIPPWVLPVFILAVLVSVYAYQNGLSPKGLVTGTPLIETIVSLTPEETALLEGIVGTQLPATVTATPQINLSQDKSATVSQPAVERTSSAAAGKQEVTPAAAEPLSDPVVPTVAAAAESKKTATSAAQEVTRQFSEIIETADPKIDISEEFGTAITESNKQETDLLQTPENEPIAVAATSSATPVNLNFFQKIVYSIQPAWVITATPLGSAVATVMETPAELSTEPPTESQTETPRQTPVAETSVTQNLNFFQRIVYFVNPNWIPSATPQPTAEPTATDVPQPTGTATAEASATSSGPTVDTMPDTAITMVPSGTAGQENSLAETQSMSPAIENTLIATAEPTAVVTVMAATVGRANIATAKPESAITATAVPIYVGTLVMGLEQQLTATATALEQQLTATATALVQPSLTETTTLVPTATQNFAPTITLAKSVPLSASEISPTDITNSPAEPTLPKTSEVTAALALTEPVLELTETPDAIDSGSTVAVMPSETATVIPSETPEPTATQIPAEPTKKPGIFKRFVNFLFPDREPTVTPTLPATETPQPSPSATEIPATATEIISATVYAVDRTDVNVESGQTQTETTAPLALPPTATIFVPVRDQTSVQPTVQNPEQILPAATKQVTDQKSLAEPTVSELDDEALKFEDEVYEPTAAEHINPPVGLILTPTRSIAAEATNEVFEQPEKTRVPAYQPTLLPDTGFADQWNIPMMILVMMILLALILTVRYLRTKR